MERRIVTGEVLNSRGNELLQLGVFLADQGTSARLVLGPDLLRPLEMIPFPTLRAGLLSFQEKFNGHLRHSAEVCSLLDVEVLYARFQASQDVKGVSQEFSLTQVVNDPSGYTFRYYVKEWWKGSKNNTTLTDFYRSRAEARSAFAQETDRYLSDLLELTDIEETLRHISPLYCATCGDTRVCQIPNTTVVQGLVCQHRTVLSG